MMFSLFLFDVLSFYAWSNSSFFFFNQTEGEGAGERESLKQVSMLCAEPDAGLLS